MNLRFNGLCRADITTKNPRLVKKISKNFDIVEQKMQVVLDKDSEISKPVRGIEIMEIFSLEEEKKLA